MIGFSGKSIRYEGMVVVNEQILQLKTRCMHHIILLYTLTSTLWQIYEAEQSVVWTVHGCQNLNSSDKQSSVVHVRDVFHNNLI